MIAFFRQVRENESELITLFNQVRETEDERIAILREVKRKWDDLTEMLRGVSSRLEQITLRKELFNEQLYALPQNGFSIESVGDEQAIVSKGGFLGLGRQRILVTMDDDGELTKENL